MTKSYNKIMLMVLLLLQALSSYAEQSYKKSCCNWS